MAESAFDRLMAEGMALREANHAGARDIFAKAYAVAKELGTKANMAKALTEMGRMSWKLADTSDALKYYMEAVPLLEELDDQDQLATVLGGIGIVHGMLDDHANALLFFERSLKAARLGGSITSVAHSLGNMGLVHFRLGDDDTSLNYFLQALVLNEKLGEAGKRGVANMLGAVGGVQVNQGRYEDARASVQRAMDIHREMGDNIGIAVCMLNIGITHLRSGDAQVALEHMAEAEAFMLSVGAMSIGFELYENMEKALRQLGRDDEADQCVAKLLDLKKEQKRREAQRQVRPLVNDGL